MVLKAVGRSENILRQSRKDIEVDFGLLAERLSCHFPSF
jgi:hypothetical protein